MTSHRRGTDPAADKARAEMLFTRKQEQRREGQTAMDEYRDKQQAEVDRAARLKALRLARETNKS
jgi:hypothetical protein